MLMIRHASISIAACASRRLRMHSSRQIGVSSLFCSLRMEVEIVIPQRLFNHQQVESIEARDMVGVLEPVSRIGIATQQNVRPAFAYCLKYLYIPPRLALQLYALISRRQLFSRSSRSAAQSSAESQSTHRREFFLASRPAAWPEELPAASLRAPIPHSPAQPLPSDARAPDRKYRAFAARSQSRFSIAAAPVPSRHVPGRVDHLVREVGMFACNAFAPAISLLRSISTSRMRRQSSRQNWFEMDVRADIDFANRMASILIVPFPFRAV